MAKANSDPKEQTAPAPQEDPKPGDPGMPPAVKGAEDEGDPTRDGVPVDLTPIQTRAMADAAHTHVPDEVAKSKEVEEGKRGLPDPKLDDMTDEQCKQFLLTYGVDAPVGDARRALARMVERARAMDSARNA